MGRPAAFVVMAVALLVVPVLPVAAKQPTQGSGRTTQGTAITFLEPILPLPARLGNVTFYFNPKEISVDKSVPWGHHDAAGQDEPKLEFTHGKPHSLSFELFFDGYETRTNVSGLVAQLEKFVATQDKHRPPMVTFVWGAGPTFTGVLGSVSAKYTMFLADGTPCRATVNLRMHEASSVSFPDREHHGNETGNKTKP